MSRPHCLNRDACIAKNPGRHCRPCAATAVTKRPDVTAKRRATMKAKFDDPAYREKHAAGCYAGAMATLATPEGAERMRRLIERGRDNFASPENRAKIRIALIRRAAPWCPIELHPLNKRLRKLGFNEAERRSIILAEVPGTPEHARRAIANADLAMRLKHEREVAGRY
jgi:hypothetical protein